MTQMGLQISQATDSASSNDSDSEDDDCYYCYNKMDFAFHDDDNGAAVGDDTQGASASGKINPMAVLYQHCSPCLANAYMQTLGLA